MFNQEDTIFFPRLKSLDITFVSMGTYVGPSFSLAGMGGGGGCIMAVVNVLGSPNGRPRMLESDRHVQSSLFALCP